MTAQSPPPRCLRLVLERGDLTPEAGGPFSLCFGFWRPLMTEPKMEVVRPCRAGGVTAGAGASCGTCVPNTAFSRSTPTGPRKEASGTFPEGKIGDLTCPCAISPGKGPPGEDRRRERMAFSARRSLWLPQKAVSGSYPRRALPGAGWGAAPARWPKPGRRGAGSSAASRPGSPVSAKGQAGGSTSASPRQIGGSGGGGKPGARGTEGERRRHEGGRRLKNSAQAPRETRL